MKPRSLDTLVAAGLVAIAVLALLMAGLFVHDRYQASEARLAEVEPRIARLLGLAGDRGQLEAAVREAQGTLARHVYPAARDSTQAGNDAQQRARDVFAKAGMEVVSSQVLPAKQVKQFDRIPITLRVEGELAALQAALAVLPSLSPSLFVEGFNVQGVGTPKPDASMRLVVQIDFFVLRGRS